jgi:hypothetical protein
MAVYSQVIFRSSCDHHRVCMNRANQSMRDTPTRIASTMLDATGVLPIPKLRLTPLPCDGCGDGAACHGMRDSSIGTMTEEVSWATWLDPLTTLNVEVPEYISSVYGVGPMDDGQFEGPEELR